MRLNRSWRPAWVATPKIGDHNERNFRIGSNAIHNSNKATATVAGVGSRAPLLYGLVQAQGLIVAVKVQPINDLGLLSGLYLLIVWGEGEITQI